MILLPNPQTTSVPRQGTKELLNKYGFIFKSVHFERAWSNQELMAKLKALFAGKLMAKQSFKLRKAQSTNSSSIGAKIALRENIMAQEIDAISSAIISVLPENCLLNQHLAQSYAIYIACT